METTKLAGLPAKADNKRRPKTAKRKKPNESSAGGGLTAAPSLARVDGITATSGAKSDSGIKLETSSGGGDDSGINMADTWQRNGHSADFVRQGLVDGLPPNAMTGPGSAPPPSSQDTFGPSGSGGPTPGPQSNLSGKLPFQNCGCGPPQGLGGPPPPRGLLPPNGLPMMDGPGPGGMPNFMPQQSQVFVFSTEMANRAAEAVERGLCRTIVDYHLDQPMTRQFMQSLSAGGPHPSQHFMGPPFGPPDGPPHMGDPSLGAPQPGDVGGPDMGGGSALANVELWVQQQNATLQEGPFSPSFGPSSGPMPPVHRSRSNGDASNGLGPPRCCPGPHNHPGGEFGPGPGGDPMFGPQPPPGYVHDHPHMMRGGPGRVQDENLTPEQLQRREEQLAHLQKIKQMLFPEKQGPGFEGGPPQRYPGGPPPGMYGRPGGPPPDDMMPHHHMMGGPPQRFMHHGGPPGMMVPPGGMIDQPGPPDGMMMMGGMGPPFGGGEPGLPPNWEMMTNEEKEWFRLQQEYYMEQRQKRQMQLQQMGGGGPPPPGYFSDMPRQPPGRASGPLSPVSPSFNGPSPHDPQGFFFQGQPGMNFPPGRPPNFPPNGPVGGPPNFNPDFGPHPDGGNFPPYGNPMMMQEPGGPFPGGRFPPVCGGKPKRKRGGNVPPCMPGAGDRPGDDIFRHLQPAPSPQQFCSLNLFDGQELTITKQLNLAYQEPTSSSPSQPTCTPPPVTTAPSRKKKKSNNDMRIKSENIEGGTGNPLSPIGQLAPESNELDRPTASPSVSGMRPTGGSGPITSATLASLQRGVESLSDRIQADMLRGGPFGAVQMPEPDEVGEADERRSNVGGMPQDPSRNNPMRGLPDNPMMQGGGDPTGDRSPPSGCGSMKQDPSSLLSPQTSGIDGMLAASQSNRYTTSGGPSSVQSPGAMIGNASVQIEPRAPNTIQYLPTRPPTSSDLEHMVAMERQGGMPPESQDLFRQMGGPGYCPNGAPMLPPGYDGPIPPGYNGPMARFDGPGYGGPPLSPGGMPQHRGGPMQFHGDMMFPDGGPMPFPGEGQMMHSGAGGPMPYHGGRPMFYRSGGGAMPPQGGPMYRGQNPQMMMPQEFRDGGGPERHGQLMAMGGGMRPNGNQMMMMGSGRPVLPPDQPPIPANPPPARSRTESRSKKSKDAKRRAADAAAAARQNPPVCEDNAMMLGGRPDPRGGGGPMPPFGGPGQMQGPPMGFPPGEGGVMMMERMRPGPGPMMMGGDGSPGMMRHPEGMMMSPEEFEMMRQGSAMMGPDGRIMMPRGGGAMRNEQMMMMMKSGMRPGDGELMPPGMMMQMGPRGEDMRNDPGMMGPGGDMRPGSGMMGLPPPGMMGLNEMRQGPGGMMEMRPGSGMMMSGDGRPGSGMMGPGGEIMRPGSAVMGQGDGRPSSGMLLPNDMNQIPGSMGSCDPRPGSGMVVMSPREDGSGGDGSGRNRQHGNGKGHMQQHSEGPQRPDSAGKRLEAEMMQGMGSGMMLQGGCHRPGSKMMMPGSSDGEMRPGSVAGMEMIDGGMRPGSAIMMGMGGPGEGRMRGPGPDMMGPDGGMRPGSALMMGMGPGDMRSRQDMMMMGMDPMEMGMRPGSEIMMAMGPGDGGMRPGGGPVMMGMNPGNDGGMRPGPDMMGMGPGEVRMRPGSAAMMMGMVPGSEGQMMMGPNDGGMIMMGPGGENMAMMGMNPGDFDPRGCPPEMMNSHRMGPMGPRMLSPGDMRYDGAGPMVPMRMNRPRGELDFRMMGGMDPGMRSGPYGGPGMRNGNVCPADRQMMMMMMNAGPNSGGPMQPGDFGPGMGGPPLGPSDGAQFQQFQQQLYATKGHHSQQGPSSPMMMMGGGGGPGGNFSGFDQLPNGPPVRFGPPGSGVM